MLLTIDFSSEKPIYMQIRDGVVEGIASGTLHDGDSLPSIRSFAAEAGVNLHTVSKAYNLLKAEGFIDILRNKGAIIHAGNSVQETCGFLDRSRETLRGIVSEARTRGISREIITDMIIEFYKELGGNN